MAYTEIHPIKSTLKKALDYICNPEKTDEKILVSSFGCSHETADMEFQFTLDQTKMKKGDNLAWHFTQSFDYDEITPEAAHKIGMEMAEHITGGRHEYVLTTHIDKGHVHNHMIFCAADFVQHKKYNSNYRSLGNLQRESDRICREKNLAVIIPGKGHDLGLVEYTDKEGQRVTRPATKRGKHWKEYRAEQQGGSRKQQLQQALDRYIGLASDFDDMLRRMEADGFTVKRASYHSYKLPGADEKTRFTGGPSLGPEYTDERIRERIAGITRPPARRRPALKVDDGRINLIVQLESIVEEQQNMGANRRMTIANLKQAAKTVNYLTENNMLHYEQLQGKITDVQAASQQAGAALKQVEHRLADLAVTIKHIDTYQRTKAVYGQYRQAGKHQKDFRQRHESEVILHEAARRALKDVQVDGKLPNLARLRAEYTKLEQEKESVKQAYNTVKKQVKLLDTVKTNIDQLLSIGTTGREQQQTVDR